MRPTLVERKDAAPCDAVTEGRYIITLYGWSPGRWSSADVATTTAVHEHHPGGCLWRPVHSNVERIPFSEVPERLMRGVAPPHERCEHCNGD